MEATRKKKKEKKQNESKGGKRNYWFLAFASLCILATLNEFKRVEPNELTSLDATLGKPPKAISGRNETNTFEMSLRGYQSEFVIESGIIYESDIYTAIEELPSGTPLQLMIKAKSDLQAKNQEVTIYSLRGSRVFYDLETYNRRRGLYALRIRLLCGFLALMFTANGFALLDRRKNMAIGISVLAIVLLMRVFEVGIYGS